VKVKLEMVYKILKYTFINVIILIKNLGTEFCGTGDKISSPFPNIFWRLSLSSPSPWGKVFHL
jgi:hypothetical protein